jgi:hypothetical protein
VREALPRAEAHEILRFDTRAMYEALDEERRRRSLTWEQMAAALPGFTKSMLMNLETGPLIGFPRVMVIPQWLGRPAADFIKPRLR